MAAPAHPVVQNPMPTPTPAVGAYRCVVCGSPTVQKISALYRGGSWEVDSTGTSVGLGYVSGGHLVYTVAESQEHGHGQTHLAAYFRPPDAPHPPRSYYAAAYVGFGFGLFLLIVAFLAQRLPVIQVIIGLLAVACSLAGWREWAAVSRGLKERQVEWEADMDAWQTSLQRWGQLFYCGRCDQVYDPNTGRHAPPVWVRSLL